MGGGGPYWNHYSELCRAFFREVDLALYWHCRKCSLLHLGFRVRDLGFRV